MQGQGDRDVRATTLLSLLHPNQNQQQQQQQQAQHPPPPLTATEPNIYPISTPQPYPPSSASTTLAGSSADSASTSTAETTTLSSVNSLFRDIAGQLSAQQQQQQQQQQQSSPPPSDLTGSGHAQHPHLSEQPASSQSSINTERQNALLSLLGNVASPPSESASLDGQQRVAPPSNQNQMSSSESQGRYLLDQLLPGSDNRSVTGHVQPPSSLESYRPGSGSPSHTQSVPTTTSPPLRHTSPPSASGAEQVMDPTRRSRFEYYSPFDAFAAPSQQQQPQATIPTQQQASATRKKPVPPVDGGTASSGSPAGSGPIQQRTISPRVQELQQLGQQFPRHLTPENVPGSRNQSDAESSTGFERPANPVGGTSTTTRMSPMNYQSATGSSSPTDVVAEPVTTIHAALKDQETSSNSSKDAPRTREELRPKPSAAPQPFVTPSKPARSSPITYSAPTYNLDMSSTLHSIAAAPGLSAVTPIALLKLENVYSPGTTIAVSTFIAYAMTRGRVRLIARSNGSRYLLHLPPSFNQGTSATDMVVSGSYLASVTSDGGLVIWDVPHELDENPPVPVVLHVSPPPPSESAYALRLVKWHPKQLGGTSGTTSGTIAVASDREVYVFNVADALDRFRGEEVALGDLATISSVITVPSPLVGFTFDVPQVALATISIDSTIMLWSIKDRLPFWTGRVPGEGLPSSIDFLEGGLLVGRKQGTVLQLLPVMSATVAATVKLNMPAPGGKSKDAIPAGTDEEGIFAHVGYDPRIKTIWAAHSARPSLFAIRLLFDTSGGPPTDVTGATRLSAVTTPVIEQIIEFPIPMQCINMAILVSSDPSSTSPLSGLDDPMTPSIGSFDNGSPTAVASFAMHQGGVDQINIAMSTFEQALTSVPAKLPPATYGPEPAPPQIMTPPKKVNSPAAVTTGAGASSSQRVAGVSATASTLPIDARPRSPISDVEAPPDVTSATPRRPGKNGKGDAKTSTPVKGGDKAIAKSGAADAKGEEASPIAAKDLRRVEDNLHSRISKLLSKELDRQQQRIEDLRRADQEADFARQETILKLISTELTKNTTRVVEQAIKSEVQNTVLPALEAITKNEIKAALGNQVAKGIADSLKGALPGELERLLVRSDISAHIARTFTTNVTPLVERQVRESFTKTLIPAYQQASQAMQVDLARDMSSEILGVKKEIITWQSDAIRGAEIAVRDVEQTVRSLNDQVRALQIQVQSLQTQQVQAPPPHMTSGMSPAHSSSPSGVLPPQPIQATHSNLQHPLPHQHISTSSHLRSGALGTFNSSSALPALLSQQLSSQSTQQQPQPTVSQQQTPPSWQSGPGPIQQPQGPPPPQPQPQSQQQQYQPPPQAQPIPTYAQQPYKPQQHQGPLPQQIALQQGPPIARGVVGGNVGGGGEDWDDVFLATLQRQDPRQLRDLLARCNPDVIMPAKRELSPIGQAVVLTLIHRLSESLPDLSPQDESLRAALWWLQRTAYTLNPSDPMIEAYVDPVLNTSQQILTATANRLVGYPDLQNTIAQIQRTLSIKP